MFSLAEIERIKAYLRDGVLPPVARSNQYRFKAKAEKFEIRGNALYHKETGLEVVNAERARTIIINRYKDTTLGRDKLYYQLSKEYYGISLRDINKILQAQPGQQLHKPVPTKSPTVAPTKVSEKNNTWLIDTTIYEVGAAEKLYIVVIIDAFTKFIWAKGFVRHNNKAITAADTAGFIRTVMTDQNFCKKLRSDGGVEFMGAFDDFLKGFARTHNGYPKHMVGGPYLKSNTAMVERANKTIKSMMAKYLTINAGPRLKAGPNVLDWIVEQYNQAKHDTTGATPESLHYGPVNRQAELNAANRIRKIADKTVANTHREFPKVSIGDSVRVSIFALKPELLPQREKKFLKGYKRQWSKEVYRVDSKKGYTYIVSHQGKTIKTTRNNLQLI